MSDERFVRRDPNPKPLDALKPPDFDVREYRTDEDIDNVVRTLDEEGQVLPILIGTQTNGQYPILDGNHRYLAAKRLGWPSLDTIQTKQTADEDEVQIVANVSRLELSPSERLSVFDYMLNRMDLSVAQAADRTGIDRSQAHRYQSILQGFGEIREFYVQGEIGMRACYQLNRLEDRDRAVEIAETAVREGYVDKDIVHQAQYAKGEEDTSDRMNLGRDAQTKQNLDQVRRNAQELAGMDSTDEQALRDAQVAPDSGQGGQGDPGQDAPQEPQGKPCAGCGEPTEAGHLANMQFHPKFAEQLGVAQLGFGAECTAEFVKWWQQRQDQTNATEKGPETADE